MGQKRRRFSNRFKAKVAIEALRGEHPIRAIAAANDISPTQVVAWKKQALLGLEGVFLITHSNGKTSNEIEELHAKIGKLSIEIDRLTNKLVS